MKKLTEVKLTYFKDSGKYYASDTPLIAVQYCSTNEDVPYEKWKQPQ